MNTTTAPVPTTTAFHLVDDPFWISLYRDHFGRVPKTLADKNAMDEERRHRQRMNEIKAMTPKLALLDALLPALAEHGIKLNHREITPRREDSLGVVLRMYPTAFNLADDKLHAALLAIGFREVARNHVLGTDTVTLKHGRALHLQIEVSPPAA